jgi:hypothetical protein
MAIYGDVRLPSTYQYADTDQLCFSPFVSIRFQGSISSNNIIIYVGLAMVYFEIIIFFIVIYAQ